MERLKQSEREKGEEKMLPVKLVRSLVFGETINNNPLSQNHHIDHDDDADDDDDGNNGNDFDAHHTQTGGSNHKPTKSRTPFLLFLPTKELVTDTYRLATIARDMGMDLHPTPSLSHIILSYPPPPSPSSSSPSSTSPSSFPSSYSWSSTALPQDTVPLPFPSLSTASLSHLRAFVKLSKGLFKLVFVRSNYKTLEPSSVGNESNWNCCSMSLFSRLSGNRIDTMEGFSRALAGLGWTFFKTKENPSTDSGDRRVCGGKSVYLFRKVDTNRVRACSAGECRIRELRLPPLDFRNAPLRILQYILLMTDDIFYLA